MARTRVLYRCSDCGAEHPKWAGQCNGCASWATLEEAVAAKAAPAGAPEHWSGGAATPFNEVAALADPVARTGVTELDRALGGGLVSGSVTLLVGEPGIGKSTLLLPNCAGVPTGSNLRWKMCGCRPRPLCPRCSTRSAD